MAIAIFEHYNILNQFFNDLMQNQKFTDWVKLSPVKHIINNPKHKGIMIPNATNLIVIPAPVDTNPTPHITMAV